MSRGVPKELESEIHRTLGEYVNGKPGSLRHDAIGYGPLDA